MITDAQALRHTFAALVVASVVAFTAGCALLPESAAGGGAGGGSGSDNSDGPANGDDTDSDEDGGEGAKVLTGADCLPGDWSVDNDSFAALMSGASGGAVDTVTGLVMLTFTTDGKTQTRYENWKHSITVDSATVTIVKNGTDFGTYSVNADGSVALVDAEISSDTTSVMDIGGQKVSHTVTPEPSVFSQASFDCNGDDLSVTAEGATTILHRER
jgi:hypothetical protein